MPSFDYNSMHKVAEDLLNKFGTFGTLTTKGFTVADQTKPWERTAVESNDQVLMVTVPWSKTDIGRYFNEDIISATTKAIILWDDDAPVKADDEITYLGKTWMVQSIKPINPAGTGLIRVCALSGGE